MADSSGTMDILILGQARFSTGDPCQLIVVATFGQNKAIERLSLDQSTYQNIENATNLARAFIESGSPSLDQQHFEKLGSAMFDLVFRGKIRDLFNAATGAHREPLLPCEITCEDSSIARWPWEYLFNTTQPQFLCEEKHPVSRRVITLDRRSIQIQEQSKIRILFAFGARQDDPRITPAEERQVLVNVFKRYLTDDNFSLTFIDLGNGDQIEDQLDKNPCDILHYFGHAGYDLARDEGYLRIDRSGTPFKLWAKLFGQMMHGRNIRLVFLNACKTAASSSSTDSARSSVAGGLHARGIPTVVGTQFSMPDNGAHYFSSTFYNMLSSGKSVTEAIHRARRAMNYPTDVKFFDWGIPVLFCSDPNAAIFPAAMNKATDLALSTRSDDRMEAKPEGHSLSLVENAINESRSKAKVSVGLVDIDSKVGFLPALVEQANRCQSYYSFQVFYLPVAAGYVKIINGLPQTYVPNIADYLVQKRSELQQDYLCCLTENLIAGLVDGREYWNHFSSSEGMGGYVSCISTYNLRKYAQEAGASFSKACLSLCLSMLLMGDPRWNLYPHKETYGCPLDYLKYRPDIVVGLRKMKFDHIECRRQINDSEQLKAIDALLALPNT